MQSHLALAVLFAFLPFVAAHGYVSAIAIDGQWYAGNQPNNYKGELRLLCQSGCAEASLEAPAPSVWCRTSAQ